MNKLTDEQKNQLLAEVGQYLANDCYDFAVDVGGIEIRAGAFTGLDEDAVMAELDDSDPNIDLVRDELEAAKKKHPKFVDCLVKAYDDNRNRYVKARRRNVSHIQAVRDDLQGYRDDLKWSQDNKLVDVADILLCKICEAEETYLTNDLAHARQELAQCAAVCIRAMEYVEKEMEEKK